MRLATSTGDFSWYTKSSTEEIESFKDTKFKYINLEQSADSAIMGDEERVWLKQVDDWGNAAASSGLTFVVSHAPCRHFASFETLQNPDNESFQRDIRAIRRSIEACHLLGIERIVVHACTNTAFSEEQFYAYNRYFYRQFFDLAEKYGVIIMTENWDNNDTHFSTGKEIRDFLEYMEHPLLAACWDTAHGNIDGTARERGQYQNIIDIGDKLKGMHISDNFGDVHHHTWPFAGIINFDSVMLGLRDVAYDGYFTFEASYSLMHQNNIPYHRKAFEYTGDTVTKLLNPSIELKKQATDLLYEIGKYILKTYDCFEQ